MLPNLSNNNAPYAIISQGDDVCVYEGELVSYEYLADVPQQSVMMIPFSQVHEKGYDYVGAQLPILALTVRSTHHCTKDECLAQLETATFGIDYARDDDGAIIGEQIGESVLTSNMTDEQYTQTVRRVIDDEIIDGGEGPNFVLARQFYTQIQDFCPANVHQIFCDLLRAEEQAHMTFVFFDGERYWVGSTPEAHLRVRDGVAMMNPISGTLPKRHIDQLDEFLNDPKEIAELHHVTDEEIKMMSLICAAGGEVRGPFLKEMNSVIHTEYYLEGQCSCDTIDALRTSMFAATLVGAPVENACRIITTYENVSRGYYGGCIATYGLPSGHSSLHSSGVSSSLSAGGEVASDTATQPDLDSGIIIRTAMIDSAGRVTLQAGASIVEYSDPAKECRETHAKAHGFVRILHGELEPFVAVLPHVPDHQLKTRTTTLSPFLMQPQRAHDPLGRRLLLLHNRDDFVYTLGHMCTTLGYDISYATMIPDDPAMTALSLPVIDGSSDLDNLATYDAVIVGPGPGDPRTMHDRQALVSAMIAQHIPLVGVCLGHQLISVACGYEVVRQERVTQGVAQSITIDGRVHLMGYYNSFGVLPPREKSDAGAVSPVFEEITNDAGYIDCLRAPQIETMQFHPESLLSYDGYDYLAGVLQRVMSTT